MASRSDNSSTFFARGVNGGAPGDESELRPGRSKTFLRTASYVTPAAASVFAAIPSPSRIRPSNTCSVPMKSWLSSRTSSCASTSTRRDRSVNRSNMVLLFACCFTWDVGSDLVRPDRLGFRNHHDGTTSVFDRGEVNAIDASIHLPVAGKKGH